jgi:hypothetical protein
MGIYQKIIPVLGGGILLFTTGGSLYLGGSELWELVSLKTQGQPGKAKILAIETRDDRDDEFRSETNSYHVTIRVAGARQDTRIETVSEEVLQKVRSQPSSQVDVVFLPSHPHVARFAAQELSLWRPLLLLGIGGGIIALSVWAYRGTRKRPLP